MTICSMYLARIHQHHPSINFKDNGEFESLHSSKKEVKFSCFLESYHHLFSSTLCTAVSGFHFGRDKLRLFFTVFCVMWYVMACYCHVMLYVICHVLSYIMSSHIPCNKSCHIIYHVMSCHISYRMPYHMTCYMSCHEMSCHMSHLMGRNWNIIPISWGGHKSPPP